MTTVHQKLDKIWTWAMETRWTPTRVRLDLGSYNSLCRDGEALADGSMTMIMEPRWRGTPP